MKTFYQWCESWQKNRSVDPVQVYLNRKPLSGDWLSVDQAKQDIETRIFPGKAILWEDNDGDLWGTMGKIKILIRQPYEHVKSKTPPLPDVI